MSETVMQRRGRPPLSEAHRRDQRLEIARHAARLFRAQGVAGTSGEQIARAAGVSERTLWRWFRSKESCVEPLLTSGVEAFREVLRSWPEGTDMGTHLAARYPFGAGPVDADTEAVLDVVRLTREEPVLRAIWLLVHERAEATLAELIGRRLGLPADDLVVRLRAATVNTALRVATDEIAAGGHAPAESRREELAAAVRTVLTSPV